MVWMTMRMLLQRSSESSNLKQTNNINALYQSKAYSGPRFNSDLVKHQRTSQLKQKQFQSEQNKRSHHTSHSLPFFFSSRNFTNIARLRPSFPGQVKMWCLLMDSSPQRLHEQAWFTSWKESLRQRRKWKPWMVVRQIRWRFFWSLLFQIADVNAGPCSYPS